MIALRGRDAGCQDIDPVITSQKLPEPKRKGWGTIRGEGHEGSVGQGDKGVTSPDLPTSKGFDAI